jgi:fatty acyl-CoA reductase
VDELEKREKELIKGFPNTYTFTKSMAERLLKLKQGNVPMIISRPTIIDCSYAEPVPGWIDSVAAAASIYLTAGLGMLREMIADPTSVGDQIPVDFVCNHILVTNVLRDKSEKLPIYHIGTSSKNPVTWNFMRKVFNSEYGSFPFEKRIHHFDLDFYKNEDSYKVSKIYNH